MKTSVLVRTMISYAQNYEDVILRRCFAGKKDGFYIDVGAMDPVEDSVTKFFYDEGWSGINIEPNELFHRKLMEDRPRDINLNLAVGAEAGSRVMYVFEGYGNSTFEASHSDRFAELGFAPTEKKVRITTLGAICREYVKREIDFLKIDCEGWEELAIRGADWEHFRPIVVVVEGTVPLTTDPSWASWEPMLTENERYEMVFFDGLNRYYLRREYADLREHFEVPANVFDGFTPWATMKARQETETLKTFVNGLQCEKDGLQEERDQLERSSIEVERRAAELEQRLNNLSSDFTSMDERLHGAAAEKQLLTASLHTVDLQLDETKMQLSGLGEDLGRALSRNTELSLSLQECRSRLSELESAASERQIRMEETDALRCHVEAQLKHSRLWVGQLSQDLARCSSRKQ